MKESKREAADWAAWLDQWENEIWPIFYRRGISKDAAAMIYFSRPVEGDITDDEGGEWEPPA